MSRALPLMLAITGCAAEDYARLYHTEEVAPSLSWEELATLDHMGPVLVDRLVGPYTGRALTPRTLLPHQP